MILVVDVGTIMSSELLHHQAKKRITKAMPNFKSLRSCQYICLPASELMHLIRKYQKSKADLQDTS